MIDEYQQERDGFVGKVGSGEQNSTRKPKRRDSSMLLLTDITIRDVCYPQLHYLGSVGFDVSRRCKGSWSTTSPKRSLNPMPQEDPVRDIGRCLKEAIDESSRRGVPDMTHMSNLASIVDAILCRIRAPSVLATIPIP